jgi:hypothetical protein
VDISTSRGRISEWEGTRRTSSKVRPSIIVSSSMKLSFMSAENRQQPDVKK